MVAQRTAKAEFVSTTALYGWYNASKIASFDRAVDRVDALGSRAPSQILLVVHVRSSKEGAIAVSEERMIH